MESFFVNAPPAAVWKVIGKDWEHIDRFMPSIATSKFLIGDKPGIGARRECVFTAPISGMDKIEEQITEWDEGTSFTYVFDNPPWPMRWISNTWTLVPEEDGTMVVLEPVLRLRGRGFQWLSGAIMAKMTAGLRKDFPNMQANIEKLCEA